MISKSMIHWQKVMTCNPHITQAIDSHRSHKRAASEQAQQETRRRALMKLRGRK